MKMKNENYYATSHHKSIEFFSLFISLFLSLLLIRFSEFHSAFFHPFFLMNSLVSTISYVSGHNSSYSLFLCLNVSCHVHRKITSSFLFRINCCFYCNEFQRVPLYALLNSMAFCCLYTLGAHLVCVFSFAVSSIARPKDITVIIKC